MAIYWCSRHRKYRRLIQHSLASISVPLNHDHEPLNHEQEQLLPPFHSTHYLYHERPNLHLAHEGMDL
uniref:Uncharacterized protein n=1 Tax=Picea glauca TaxID=3330 RepID=A0A101M189_PICGL|nr:hypothetical protein ABT39_MTgene4389 [Picea glauca]QHR90785.1 hypothetical protein Q903MT_gene4811 [Picea sitchensis]